MSLGPTPPGPSSPQGKGGTVAPPSLFGRGAGGVGRALTDVLAPAAALIAVSLYLAATTPGFATVENFRAIGLQVAVMAIIAVGQTGVIVAGGIDLSVGSVVALSGVTAVLRMTAGTRPGSRRCWVSRRARASAS